MIIDFHTHILPGIDDGSREIAQTEAMWTLAKEQGVEELVATPHFYASRARITDFLEKRNHSYETVCQYYEDRDDAPKIRLGAEVYYFSGMSSAEHLSELCIEGTNAILIEMPFTQWDTAMLHELESILQKRKLHIILAHVERYPHFQKDHKIWKEVMALPVTKQLNAGCFLEWRRRRFAKKMLHEHQHILIGSDCHNMDSRKPNLGEARSCIEKKIGKEYLENIDAWGMHLLKE